MLITLMTSENDHAEWNKMQDSHHEITKTVSCQVVIVSACHSVKVIAWNHFEKLHYDVILRAGDQKTSVVTPSEISCWSESQTH